MTPTEEATLKLEEDELRVVLPTYKSILIATDASDHSNRGVADAAELGSLWQSTITGAHVYAAKLHDLRFRQMEGGLPEQYQEETELEKQRDIHDALITKGLSAITESYLDRVEQTCQQRLLSYRRCALEGKNYRELTNEANKGVYDLLIMGSLGLGAVTGSRIGTVCERVARRSRIDSLIIKDPKRSLSSGPIVVAVDGSTRAYGGLLTGLSLARAWNVPLYVISAFDPYYHYVAFNRIAGVLSEKARKVFRFKEQEKLHEEIIDAGLAKIYQGHLDVAEGIAEEQGIEISTTLLDGKPYEVIEKFLEECNPSLLIIGKLGIHADDQLDIGGNAENLLRNVSCSVWLSQRHYRPRAELIAEASTSWTNQAEQRMNEVPEFVRAMARLGVLRYAQDQGHTVITDSIVQEATKRLCPHTAGRADTGSADRK
jgi:nucleotide-binding universal stress UspA family protein